MVHHWILGKPSVHWGLFCTAHWVLQVELSLFTTPVMFSTRLSTIACTLSMLSRLSSSKRPCRDEIWLLALRRLADILLSFTWEKARVGVQKIILALATKAGGLLKAPVNLIFKKNRNSVCVMIGCLPTQLWESTSLPGRQNVPPFGRCLIMNPHPVYSTRNVPWWTGARSDITGLSASGLLTFQLGAFDWTIFRW